MSSFQFQPYITIKMPQIQRAEEGSFYILHITEIHAKIIETHFYFTSRVTKSKRKSCVRHVAHLREMRNVDKIVDGNAKVEIPLGRQGENI
jgi:hypothetical protein